MKESTFQFILDMIRAMNEDVAAAPPPTNSASTGQVSGLSGKEGDLPPIDLRKKRYKKLPEYYRNLFRRNASVGKFSKS